MLLIVVLLIVVVVVAGMIGGDGIYDGCCSCGGRGGGCGVLRAVMMGVPDSGCGGCCGFWL